MAHSTRFAEVSREHRTTPSQPLPQYLLRRGSTFYFKRKVPKGLEHAFPEAQSGQVWKSLETSLLHQAEVILRAEVAHFDMRVAQAREPVAAEWAADLKAKMARAAPVRKPARDDEKSACATAPAGRLASSLSRRASATCNRGNRTGGLHCSHRHCHRRFHKGLLRPHRQHRAPSKPV